MIKKYEYNNNKGSCFIRVLLILLLIISIFNLFFIYNKVEKAIYDQWDDYGISSIASDPSLSVSENREIQKEAKIAVKDLKENGSFYKLITLACLIISITSVISASKYKKKVLNIILGSACILINLLIMFLLFSMT